MGFIESLNKCAYKIPLNKTIIYKKIEDAKLSLDALGIKIKVKNEFDLFQLEVIYRAMLTQNQIENTYELFLNHHYDLLDYLNYDEKQKMFNNDIAPVLKDAPHFFDEESKTEIYIPYLESFVNQRYTHDYQIMMLKQHRDYVKQFQITYDLPAKLYGNRIYRTDFSSLENVYEDYRHVCMYYDDLKTIFIFSKENNALLNQLIVQDHLIQDKLPLEKVKCIAKCLEEYHYQECLELMKEYQWIGEKTYKKIMKKYK